MDLDRLIGYIEKGLLFSRRRILLDEEEEIALDEAVDPEGGLPAFVQQMLVTDRGHIVPPYPSCLAGLALFEADGTMLGYRVGPNPDHPSERLFPYGLAWGVCLAEDAIQLAATRSPGGQLRLDALLPPITPDANRIMNLEEWGRR